MEKNNTTTYITAKKRIGCKAPIVVDFLVLMIEGFSLSKKLDFMFNLLQYYSCCIVRIKILVKLVVCKRINTQLSNGQKTIDPAKNYYQRSENLSNSELVAILIHNGTKKKQR